jgi:predicted nucleic acid-binding protein
MWIAASAMEHGLELVTLDRHFDDIQGLLKMNMGV